MLNMIPETFGFLMNSSKISSILREFRPNSDVKSSNGSVPRRSNLPTKAGTAGDRGRAGPGAVAPEDEAGEVWRARRQTLWFGAHSSLRKCMFRYKKST